jgi:MFS transporter, FHS family, L-fucose permease
MVSAPWKRRPTHTSLVRPILRWHCPYHPDADRALVCGPPKYAEFRINLSQAFNGIGTVVAPVLGSYVFFAFDDERARQNVQWVYLSIAVFVLLLAIVFFFSRIPEITDADMEFQAVETHGESDKPWYKHYRAFHAAIAQFCYTGAQIAIAS